MMRVPTHIIHRNMNMRTSCVVPAAREVMPYSIRPKPVIQV